MIQSQRILSLILACAAGIPAAAQPIHPTRVTAAEAAGPVFLSPQAEKVGTPDKAVNVTMLGSGDRKMVAGIYRAGPSTFDAAPYPVDEFMYFLEGSVTLTSQDGTVMQVAAGDAVTIPKGWRGKWETKGYKKYYVIYSAAGMGPGGN